MLQRFVPNFTLKRLLLVVAMLGGLLALTTQIGIGTAEFEIWENNLELNEDQLVEGTLRWGYQGTEHEDDEAWPFFCTIRNVSNRDLLNLKAGSKAKVRYRYQAIGPLLTQDPYQMYIARVLGISKDKIVGYAITYDSTQVIIDGSYGSNTN